MNHQLTIELTIELTILVGRLEQFFPYIGNNHPNWLSYFSERLKPPTSIELTIRVGFPHRHSLSVRLLHLQSGTCMATAYETCTGKEARQRRDLPLLDTACWKKMWGFTIQKNMNYIYVQLYIYMCVYFLWDGDIYIYICVCVIYIYMVTRKLLLFFC